MFHPLFMEDTKSGKYACGLSSTPSGPGAYNVTGMGADSMRKAYLEATRKGVFGTTSSRSPAIHRRDEPDVPGGCWGNEEGGGGGGGVREGERERERDRQTNRQRGRKRYREA